MGGELGAWAATYYAVMSDATSRIGMMATGAMGLLIAAVEQIPPESWDQPSILQAGVFAISWVMSPAALRKS